MLNKGLYYKREVVMNKEELNELMKAFIEDCKDIGEKRYPRDDIQPTFNNFINWLDGRTWDMR
jgi:hypothetical protein